MHVSTLAGLFGAGCVTDKGGEARLALQGWINLLLVAGLKSHLLLAQRAIGHTACANTLMVLLFCRLAACA